MAGEACGHLFHFYCLEQYALANGCPTNAQGEVIVNCATCRASINISTGRQIPASRLYDTATTTTTTSATPPATHSPDTILTQPTRRKPVPFAPSPPPRLSQDTPPPPRPSQDTRRRPIPFTSDKNTTSFLSGTLGTTVTPAVPAQRKAQIQSFAVPSSSTHRAPSTVQAVSEHRTFNTPSASSSGQNYTVCDTASVVGRLSASSNASSDEWRRREEHTKRRRPSSDSSDDDRDRLAHSRKKFRRAAEREESQQHRENQKRVHKGERVTTFSSPVDTKQIQEEHDRLPSRIAAGDMDRTLLLWRAKQLCDYAVNTWGGLPDATQKDIATRFGVHPASFLEHVERLLKYTYRGSFTMIDLLAMHYLFNDEDISLSDSSCPDKDTLSMFVSPTGHEQFKREMNKKKKRRIVSLKEQDGDESSDGLDAL